MLDQIRSCQQTLEDKNRIGYEKDSDGVCNKEATFYIIIEKGGELLITQICMLFI